MKRGTRVGQAYVGLTVDGDGINDDIVDSVDEAGPGVEKAGKDHGERYGDNFNKGFFDRIRGKFSKALGEQISKSAAGDEAGKHIGSDIVQGLRQKLADSHSGIRELMDRLLTAESDGKEPAFLANLTHALRSATNEATLLERELRSAMEAEGLLNRQRVSGNGGRPGRDNDRIGDTIGRLFGAGSRNNFLNILGKSLGGIVNLTEKVATGAGKMFSTFYTGFTSLEKGSSVLQRLSAGFTSVGAEGAGLASKAFSALVASGPAAVVAVIAIVGALSVMASIVGALIGLVTALAATITAALTGALLVAGGALAALAAAGGLLAVAFTSMTDAQKKMLSDAFRPLKAELTGIGQIMLEQMIPAFATWSQNLQIALMQAVPLAQVMGQAFAQAGNNLTAAFSGPGFQMFTQALATYLPGIVLQLSNALGSFLNGMLAVFAVLMPYVTQFSDYLAKVAADFSAWATTAQGQNAIADFVARAVVSLQSLWDFVTSFTSFLGKVLFSPEAMNAGNTIFDGLARTFDSFTKKIAQAQADGSLQRWFNDAIKFGSALWEVIKALYEMFAALYSSGVLNIVGAQLVFVANGLRLISIVGSPVISAIHAIGNALDWISGKADSAAAKLRGLANGAAAFNAAMGIATHLSNNAGAGSAGAINAPSMASVQHMGTAALNATSVKNGGYKPDPVKAPKQYHNPYVAYANSIIKQGPSVSSQIKNAMLKLGKAAVAGIRAAAQETGGYKELRDAMDSMIDNLHVGGQDAVNTARSALNSAASQLASASSASAAKAALRKVHKAQRDLEAALRYQGKVNSLAHTLALTKAVKWDNVVKLVGGLKASNVTLAEFAEARSRIADRIEKAQDQLTAAVALRDDMKKAVTDSVLTFGGLATAQAKTIDGIEQALTANDITSNLQDRLAQIQKFQNDLKLLVANGLSNDAYKQIVDEGVVNGTVLADALLAGGTSAIQQTNGLVGQINDIATTLGAETSSRMYQAGVDAAKGLLAGLQSIDKSLEAAATKLGDTIAKSIKKSLGIKSPSTVLRDMMDYVGDGAVLGLEDQHIKVGSAASALANLIAVNPGGPPANGGPPVSGNVDRSLFRDLVVQTPTEDPKAVAMETVNELVGRLP